MTLRMAYDHCAAVTRREARNFFYGIRLLPADKRDAMYAVYALARRIDDIGDDPPRVPAGVTGGNSRNGDSGGNSGTDRGTDSGAVTGAAVDSGARLRHLAAIREQVTATGVASARFDDPVLVAVQDAARRFSLPMQEFADLVDGVEMDVRGTSYARFDDLVAYCQRVAGSIGRLSVAIFGVDDLDRALPLADRLGLALQLTNILRDVREDAEAGRHYLPQEDVDSHGCFFSPEGRLAGPSERVEELLRVQVRRAEAAFADGLRLLPMLDRRSGACCAAMAGIYHRLLAKIAEAPQEVLEHRLALSGWEKAAIAARSLAGVHPKAGTTGG